MLVKHFLSLYIFDGEGAGEGTGSADSAESANQVAADNGAAGTENDGNEAQTQLSEKEIVDNFWAEHKDELEKRLKQQLDRRMRGVNKLKAENDKSRSYIDRQLARTGAKDIDELNEMLDSDEEYYRNASAEAGMSEKAFRELESYRLKDIQYSREQKDREIAERTAQLEREVESVRSVYPDFDIVSESENEEFKDLVQSGVPMLHAYRLTHFDDLVNGVATSARKEASRQTAESIRSKKTRDSEYGTGNGSAGSPKADIKSFSKDYCDELERRVARGERITLK